MTAFHFHQTRRASRSARRRGPARAAAVVAGGLSVAGLVVPSAAAAPADRFAQVNLVANRAAYHPALVDPAMTNAWGLAASAGGPIWVSDNGSGNASVYSGGVAGSAVSLDLTVPVPGGNPTGQVYNGTGGFPVGGSTGPSALFIVDTDSTGATQSPGEIAAWDGGASFVVEDSPSGGPGGATRPHAVFKGLAISGAPTAGPELFAADVASGTVDVFSSTFAPVATPKEFKDPALPKGYAPFNVTAVGANIYVTYVKQNAAHTDGVPGAGLGYVDRFDADGHLLSHLVKGGSGSRLNEPWGLTVAPAGFGPFAGKLLVGNLGDGRINAFDPASGAYLGTIKNAAGAPLAIPGLWGLGVGNAAFGGASAVIFSAGPGGYGDGLLGTISPAA